MTKNVVYIVIILVLLVMTIFFWQRSRELSYRLGLIQERIEESKQEKIKQVDERGLLGEAKIAIVLDDWGYNLNNLEAAWKLGVPVTLSILPNLPYSWKIAKAANNKGLEVILHLPLEPYESLRLEEGTIMIDMQDKEILRNLEKAISSVPGLMGISNHMGSRATEDEKVMGIIFGRMKKDGLYFLDSIVTSKSVCRNLSRRMGVKFVHRSVFLDNEADPEYIKGQIRELAKQALATDWAIGVGHDRLSTLEAIKEMIPELKDMGIRVVKVSELVE